MMMSCVSSTDTLSGGVATNRSRSRPENIYGKKGLQKTHLYKIFITARFFHDR